MILCLAGFIYSLVYLFFLTSFSLCFIIRSPKAAYSRETKVLTVLENMQGKKEGTTIKAIKNNGGAEWTFPSDLMQVADACEERKGKEGNSTCGPVV